MLARAEGASPQRYRVAYRGNLVDNPSNWTEELWQISCASHRLTTVPSGE
jgi:hypothetical protein